MDVEEQFGTVGMELGYITQEDVDQALETQATDPPHERRLLGLILLDAGRLSPASLNHILHVCRRRAKVLSPETTPLDLSPADLAAIEDRFAEMADMIEAQEERIAQLEQELKRKSEG